MTQTIADRCPSCGGQTLCVGAGGWLTCSRLGCPEPGVTRAMHALRARLFAAEARLARHEHQPDRATVMALAAQIGHDLGAWTGSVEDLRG